MSKNSDISAHWESVSSSNFLVILLLFGHNKIRHDSLFLKSRTRSKDKYSIELGAKLGVSEVCGLSRIDHISWDDYSESKDLTLQVENYKELFGYYLEVVFADGAYMGRENRAYLYQRNIRHIGKTLGRPRQLSRSMRQERAERNHIEGKFGQAKNGYGLTNIRARRKDTSEAWIGGIWLAMNLKRYMSLQPVVALWAIIQLVIAFLYLFLDKITTWGEATTACWDELKSSFDPGEPCKPVLGSTPSWVGAH
jgi:Transposase DDE domain